MSLARDIVQTIEGAGAELRVNDDRVEIRGADKLPEHLHEALRDEIDAIREFLLERDRSREQQAAQQPAEAEPFYAAEPRPFGAPWLGPGPWPSRD